MPGPTQSPRGLPEAYPHLPFAIYALIGENGTDEAAVKERALSL